jgi:hypothetical protein
MENIQIFIMMIVIACIVKAAIKTNAAIRQQRKMVWFSKTIYYYQGKTQQQILAILQLELTMLNLVDYEISHFSKPLFKKDASAEYIVYLKRVDSI